jgi:hypothetical protein
VTPDRRRFAVRLLWLLAAGATVRGILLVLTPGEYYDMANVAHVGAAFLHAPLHAYDIDINPGSYQGSPTYPWPYLPAYIPAAGAMSWISAHIGVTVSHLDRALIVCVDLTLAWFTQWLLGRLGRSDRERLQGAALIALGPPFIAVSAVHGQLDALAFLPAVAAVGLWELRRNQERALLCGLLIGMGIAIKTTPGLILLALAPTARDRRELFLLLIGAAIIPVASVIPFALAAPRGLKAIIDYGGFAGRAGLTLLFQPRLALHDLTGTPVTYDATTRFLLAHSTIVLAVAVIPVAVIVWIRRLPAATAAVALLLAFYVAGTAVLPQYWLSVVPFMVLANRTRMALLYQVALVPLLVATYAFIQEPDQPMRRLSPNLVLYGYVPWLWIFTLGLLVALVVVLRAPRGDPAAFA